MFALEKSEFFLYTTHDAQTDRAAVRAEIEVLRRERLAYEQEGMETRQALARSEAHCRTLEARVTVLETEVHRHEWQRQAADDLAVQYIMRTQALEAVEQRSIEAELWNLKVIGTDVVKYNQRFQELALLCVRMFPEESDKIERETMMKTREARKNTFRSKSEINKQQQNRGRNTGQGLPTAGNSDRKSYGVSTSVFKCNLNHEGDTTEWNVQADRTTKATVVIKLEMNRAPARCMWFGKCWANPDNVVSGYKYIGRCLYLSGHMSLQKEVEDKSEKKRLEGYRIHIIQDCLNTGTLSIGALFLPPEMKCYLEQLKELSDKGFIRPSSSPWGAGLVVKKKD
ncbi:hypothetical protein Tco_0794369 [Tanacetum coccineum]